MIELEPMDGHEGSPRRTSAGVEERQELRTCD
jgi:hypothetical protein